MPTLMRSMPLATRQNRRASLRLREKVTGPNQPLKIWFSTTMVLKTNLIGTPRQIAQRIVALKALGVDLVLAGFLHFQEEVEYFGRRVLPLVRELEASTLEQLTPA